MRNNLFVASESKFYLNLLLLFICGIFFFLLALCLFSFIQTFLLSHLHYIISSLSFPSFPVLLLFFSSDFPSSFLAFFFTYLYFSFPNSNYFFSNFSSPLSILPFHKDLYFMQLAFI